ncbi:hypothetical protein MGYG_01816 [Nannizzia gypsea CBS 118893]|uniref:Uncharacterized protein n=1 Tax=Arthroderma gypseum (strain ATCC MYA-4604 / CBS 118893) TaxID=535722 RepID=E5R3K1_ARTGP|nr:hypothetical protein MGYG_01816 [Nannizzia gypsea CBS 118893]EFQ98800.1 hypothetical protein MGYG_01816 [Nannizzia gypsea CBS 118893]
MGQVELSSCSVEEYFASLLQPQRRKKKNMEKEEEGRGRSRDSQSHVVGCCVGFTFHHNFVTNIKASKIEIFAALQNRRPPPPVSSHGLSVTAGSQAPVLTNERVTDCELSVTQTKQALSITCTVKPKNVARPLSPSSSSSSFPSSLLFTL